MFRFALAFTILAGAAYVRADEGIPQAPVMLPTFEQAPPTLPVLAAPQPMDVPATVLLSVNQCPDGLCGTKRSAAFAWNPPFQQQGVAVSYQQPKATTAAVHVRVPVQAAPAVVRSTASVQTTTTYKQSYAAERPGLFARLFSGERMRLFGKRFGGGLFGGCGK